MADEQATKDEVLAHVKALNETWTKGDGSALRNYFHPNMVAITATDQDILYGRDACLGSWQAFARSAQIRRWEEIEPQVQLYGDTAIVTYYYDMAFDMDGRKLCHGRARHVRAREGERPLVGRRRPILKLPGAERVAGASFERAGTAGRRSREGGVHLLPLEQAVGCRLAFAQTGANSTPAGVSVRARIKSG